MAKVEMRPVDSQGRIILPKSWRERKKTKNVVIIDEDDRLEIRAVDTDLSRFVDAIPVDTEEYEDYHALRRDLRKNAVR
jgi:AbrB family looped-hinge helix DNA binding protein